MVRGSYILSVGDDLFFFFFFGLQPAEVAIPKWKPLFKSLDPPLFTQHESKAQNVVLLARD